MAHRTAEQSTRALDYRSGADVLASCGPLTSIVAKVLANQPDTKQVLRHICAFLSTDHAFIPAVRSCEIQLPVTFGPPATANAAAFFAGWRAKCGCLVSTLQLDLLPQLPKRPSLQSLSKRTVAEQAIAAALHTASAAASSASALQIRACKLKGLGLGTPYILQALPGSTLTRLVLEIDLPDVAPEDEAREMTVQLGTALQQLQQLRTLKLECSYTCDLILGFDAALPGLGALTNLTRLEVLLLESGELLQHLPASLVQLQVQLPAVNDGPLLMGHLTGLTQLMVGEYNVLRRHHVLPPNLRQLTAGNAEAASCLLPLTQLQDLLLLCIEHDVMPAAEMQQLTSLTALTNVELRYWADAGGVDAAAAGWRALPLEHLHLTPDAGSESLHRSTLLQLTSLTGLGMLDLWHCGLENVGPAELAEVLSQLASLYRLRMHGVRWQQQQQQQEGQAAAVHDAGRSPLASFLHVFAARMQNNFNLCHLCLCKQHVGRAEAAALAGMRGLQALSLRYCQLEDCSVAEIALSLKPWLVKLNVSGNPAVTDGCLPVLAHAELAMASSDFSGTAVTPEGLKRYMLDSLDA